MNKQAHIHLKTTFKSTYVNQCIVTRNTYNSFRNDATYRLLIASVSSNYILHIVTETRCVISIKLTYPLLYFFSLIKTTNSKKYLPLPLPKFYLKFYGSCLARGFFFPLVYLAITAIQLESQQVLSPFLPKIIPSTIPIVLP